MEQSIFNSELTTNSNNLIFSAARWSRFLGISFLVFAGLILIFGIGILLFTGEDFTQGFTSALEQNGTFAKYPWLANTPVYAIAIVVIIMSLLLSFMGYLFYAFGKNGIDYYNSQDETAFEKTFEKAKQIFILSAISTGLGILFTIFSLFAFT